MTPKKNVTRRGSGKDRKDEFLIKLLLNAKVEVKRLLRRNEVGTVSKEELDRELEEVAASLQRVLDYTRSTLDDVSDLVQRNQADAITKAQMNIGLRKVGTQLWHIANFTGLMEHKR